MGQTPDWPAAISVQNLIAVLDGQKPLAQANPELPVKKLV
jgi:hypothetical protein